MSDIGLKGNFRTARSERVKLSMEESVISERLERLAVNGAEVSNGSMKQKGRKKNQRIYFLTVKNTASALRTHRSMTY